MAQNLQSRRGASTSNRSSPITYLFPLLSLLAFLFILVDHALWEPDPYDTSSSSSGKSPKYHSAKTNKNRLESVSCPSQITTRTEGDAWDPNKGMDESPKRFTITDPPFWISLHKKYFDMMRWVSIMDKGNYYETGITDQFHQILGNTTRPGLVFDIGMNIGWVRVFVCLLFYVVDIIHIL